MKYIKSYILFALMVMAVSGCKTDDLKDDVNDLKDRVTLLEEQVKILNDNIEVLAYILNPDNKTISSAEYSDNDKTAIIITLSNGEKLTLTVGKPGEIKEPVVTIKDGYWFINGEPTGKKAEGVDGENGGIPQFRVSGGSWQVRYVNGNGEIVVDWTNVTNGQVFDGNVDMYDSVFENVTLADYKITLVLTDDTSYELPIVADLICEIDDAEVGDDGCFEFQNGDIKTFRVKIQSEGTPLAPVYPAGWRAELEPLEQADAEGYNYQLIVYAPSGASTLTRAAVTADNKSEISIRANKGVFWAVDKIKVRLPYSNDYDAYVAGANVEIAGHIINKSTYGDITEVSSSQEITQGGVYFVTQNNATLTINSLPSANVVILTKSDEIKANVSITATCVLNADFICKNVKITRSGINQFFEINETTSSNVNLVFDNCEIIDKRSGFTWIKQNNNATLGAFRVENSSINLTPQGNNHNGFLQNTHCTTFYFVNNIVYNPNEVTGEDQSGHLINFKLFNGSSSYNISSLTVKNNTFVDCETCYSNGANGMVYANSVADYLAFENNIYYLSYPITNFDDVKTQKTTRLLRIASISASEKEVKNNYAYSGNSDMSLTLSFGVIEGAEALNIVSTGTDLLNFSKTNGTFVSVSSDYGAQR